MHGHNSDQLVSYPDDQSAWLKLKGFEEEEISKLEKQGNTVTSSIRGLCKGYT